VVLELLKKVANDHPDVLKVPAPWALFDGFGDSSLDFRIRIWTTMDNGVTTKSEVAINIYDALSDAGIEIPFPQSDLHLRSVDPEVLELSMQKQKPPTKKRSTKPKPIPKTETDRKFEDEPDEADDD
jgi:small-conductance mechanosensitive channel